MNIFYEQSMPFAREFFQSWGHCHRFNGKTVTAKDVATADVLFVRSTTQVNQRLLCENQQIKFVATATAGTDHIDVDYLKQRNISWSSAAGCNAVAVAEYVISALFVMAEELGWCLTDKKVGIVGAGQVGSALSQKLAALNIQTRLCDPPVAATSDNRKFHSMDEILECDVISLHVPWIKDGQYSTHHMIGAPELARLSNRQVLINACRGEVIDELALLEHCQGNAPVNLVLDVWQNEPEINMALLPYVRLATAHIAGHTNEGKARGTEMVYQAAAQHLGLNGERQLSEFLPEPEIDSITVNDGNDLSIIRKLALLQYDIRRDGEHFRQQLKSAADFEYIRQHYIMRREFSALKVKAGNYTGSQAIYGLGFSRP